MKVFDHLISADEEDHAMLDLKAAANFADPKTATNEISYGEYQWVTAFNKDENDDQKLQDVKDGKRYLYAFFLGQFTDQNQPRDEKYIMERCNVFYISLDVNGNCHGHNQAYVEKMR